MMMKDYKGYEIERVTRNTYVIRKGGEVVAMPGCYPKTYKAAKVIIDDLAKRRELVLCSSLKLVPSTTPAAPATTIACS